MIPNSPNLLKNVNQYVQKFSEVYVVQMKKNSQTGHIIVKMLKTKDGKQKSWKQQEEKLSYNLQGNGNKIYR